MNLSTRLYFILALALPTMASADVIIVNNDSAGEGFNDLTSVAAVGGNTGTTLGAQRLNVFQRAADILNSTFNITAPVKVASTFDPLTCTSSYGTLGQAGPATVEFDYATRSITPHALYNQQVGSDADAGSVEITAQFNSSIDNNDNCLFNTNWYYGYDAPSGNDSSLLSVVLHEVLHGMGFLSYLQPDGTSGAGWNTSGGFVEGFDPYTYLLKDASTGQMLTDQTSGTRYNVMRSGTDLVWSGSEANGESGNYSSGVNSGQIQMYAPGTYESGSSVSHFDTAMTPNELMEPQYTEFLDTAGLAEQLMIDIGWSYNAASAPNSPPVLSVIGNRTLAEDTSLSVSLSATDSDGDTLTYSLGANSTTLGASISGTTLSINPTSNFNGSGTLVVQVSDGTDTDSETITVTVSAVNDAPVLSAVGDQTVAEESTNSITLSGTDVDGDTLTYQLDSATASLGASLTGNSLSISPVANFTGAGSVTVSVSDGSLTDNETFSVTVSNINDAPVIAAISDQTMTEDASLDVTLSATDVDGDTLTFSVTSAASEVNATISGNTLSFTPDANYSGSSSVTVQVSDGVLTDSDTFSLTVSGTNDAPVLASIGSQSLNEDDTLSFSLSATDSDGDTLTYAITSASSELNASISGSTVTITPDTNYFGSASMTLSVSDGSLTDSETISVSVTNVNDAPVASAISDVDLDWDSSANMTLSASDPDGDSLTFSAVSADTSAVTASVSGSTLTLTAATTNSATAGITVTVSDGTLTHDTSFTVTLTDPAAIDPISLDIGGTSIADGQTYTADLSALPLVAAGGTGNYSFTVFFDGSDRSELINSGSLQLPSSGAFAGVYTVDITDGESNNASFYIERPLRLSTSVSPVLENSGSAVLTVEGASATTDITLTGTSGVSFNDQAGVTVSTLTAPDDAAGFNSVSALISLSDSLPTNLNGTVTATVSNIPDSELSLDIVASRTVVVTVNDSNNRPVAGADIRIDDDRVAGWGLSSTYESDANGQVSLLLPALDIDIVAGGAGLADSSVSLPAAATSLTITLEDAAVSYRLSGLIFAEGFTFDDSLPEITIQMSDGSAETVDPVSLSNTRATYEWSSTMTSAIPETMTVDHSALPPVSINLNPAASSEVVDVTLISDSESSDSSTGAGSSAPALLILLGLILLGLRGSRLSPRAT